MGPKHSRCRQCNTIAARRLTRAKKLNRQMPGGYHIFPCGCEGILPEWGKDNAFARFQSNAFGCRVSRILQGSVNDARRRNYTPVDRSTPHAIIRKLMEKPECERCGEPLVWEISPGKTPHLHHNHFTGEMYGFTHAHCNPAAMEKEINRLKRELEKSKNA